MWNWLSVFIDWYGTNAYRYVYFGKKSCWKHQLTMGISQISRIKQNKLLGRKKFWFWPIFFQSNLKIVFCCPSFFVRKAYKKSRRRLKRRFVKENHFGNNYVNHNQYLIGRVSQRCSVESVFQQDAENSKYSIHGAT